MRRARAVAAAALAAALLAAGGLAWLALAAPGEHEREELHAIPKGTWAKKAAGAKLDTFPGEIHLTLGVRDVLVLRNDDEVPQMFGPVLIMPGQSFRLPFKVAAPHYFACTAHVNGQLTVLVHPAPAWWERAWLRLSGRAA
jgi:hypothetical protein